MHQPAYNLDSTGSQPRHQTNPFPSSGESCLSLSLTPSVDSEGRGSLPSSASTGSVAGYLLSPMESSTNDVSGLSFALGSLVTPKRKLSLSVDLDESTQDASDSGYSRGDSTSSASSSHQSHKQALNFTSALEGIVRKESSSSSSSSSTLARTPLGDITNAAGSVQRTTHTQKAKRSISFPNDDKKTKVLPSPSENQRLHARISSLPPLPCSPLSHDPSSHSRKNSLHQISSPLERMTLASPGQQLYSRKNTRPFVFPSHPAREHSVESDGYSDVFDGDDSSSNTNSLPSGLSTLMNAPFPTRNEVPFSVYKPPVHSTPMVRTGSVLGPSAARRLMTRADSWCPTSSNTRRESLKRSSPCPESSEEPKKKKPPLPVLDSKTQDAPSTIISPLKGVQLLRSQSCSLGAAGEHGTFSLSPGGDNVEKIGDHTKNYALPLCKETRVHDLKCISPQTLANLLEDDSGLGLVDEYLVLDCRYPYEYEGGHVRGAMNVWSKDSLQNQFFNNPEYTTESKRKIIIFHCEFSSKRGPEMSRFMRELDRKKNGMAFPKLYYPELYLLEGGYKSFYEQFPNLCEPNRYVKMDDDDHKEELRHFKQRSKSWTGGDAAAICSRTRRRGRKLRPCQSAVVDSHATRDAAAPQSLKS